MGTMAKSPTSLMASLSTSVALYDNQEPPKTLQDILLLAQSHYISHRYVPALTLYKLAVERHHSLPACCSLYALYTSTLNVPGLVRSDTKATQILIHALRIWTARRWSSSRLVDKGPKRLVDHDEFDELEEYFAQPRRPTRSQRCVASNNKATVSIQKKTKPHPSQMKDVAASIESEYRTPLHLANLDDANRIGVQDEASEIESECESDDCSEHDEDDDIDSCDSCEDCGGWDDGSEDEDEKDEEARRIGLATAEIEDIVQKICSMIQKGVLGLEEPVLVKAVSTLRIIERGLSKEAEAWKQELSRSKSMFSLNEPIESVNSTKPDLLLTQGIDLSFLNFSPEDDNGFPVALSRPVSSRPQELRHKNSTLSAKSIFSADSKSDPANAAIVGLPSGEREQDRAFCRAIRIRTMSTLGWVHQQKGEYNYGAQAYGVCSEIATTGKRPLNILQQQAIVHRQTCEALLKKEAKKPVVSAEPIQIREQRRSENRNFNQSQISSLTRSSSGMPHTSAPSTSASTPTLTSATTSTLASTPTIASYSDVSSPSSIASSDSGAMSIRGPGAISSLSAAIWGSGIFKSTLTMASNSETESSKSKPVRKLSRSKSMLLERKSSQVWALWTMPDLDASLRV
ncbi:hypothetical protein BGZ80_009741 [Entomortierella chlamydospora]|uniref:Uncharacterized protein n=1 Tax=Entomortierella chlamydospora TaxID=101097 RepID=A0A9P6T414_9FUNG|nr:hypothetical protein BGZ80_009741 [Entomortierella chlamydospora]